jgi:AcrR family transcriptional regulator
LKQSNTKQLILSTALDLFSLRGYNGASIRQIAHVVGIRESAIYNHYKSKEDIFLAILTEFKSRTISEKILSDDLLDDLSNPENFLRNFAERLINYWNTPQEKKFIRLLLMEQFTRIGNKELSTTDYLSELRKMCRLIFSEMVKTKIVKQFNPEILAEQFIAPLFLIRTEHLVSGENENMSKVFKIVNMHVDFFWAAIKN